MPYLSIVIPTYNEEKKISADIEAVYKYFNKNSIDGELIIVNDGSKDNTYNVANNLKKVYPSLKIISYEKNVGKGFALKTGVMEAKGENILIADSGLCVPFECTNIGLELLKSGYEIAIGSRETLDKKSKIMVKQPFYRRIGSTVFQILIQFFDLIPPYVKDTQCGFKLFKREVAHALFKNMFTKKFMWDIEILKVAHKKGYKIAVFPVEWSNDSDTRFNPFIGSFENLLQILKIIIKT